MQLVTPPIAKTIAVFREQEMAIGERELAVFLASVMTILFHEIAVMSQMIQHFTIRAPREAAAVVEELERAAQASARAAQASAQTPPPA